MPPRLPRLPIAPSNFRKVTPKSTTTPKSSSRRITTAAPKPNSGPLLHRDPNRALPALVSPWRPLRTVPLFLLVLGASAAAIFNYQKLSSSVVTSTLYALRMNDVVREELGDEVYFASKVPWIWGEINQLHGRIDIRFRVKGTRERGMVRLRCERRERMGYFETLEWSLTMDDGRTIQLLRPDGPDPFGGKEDDLGA